MGQKIQKKIMIPQLESAMKANEKSPATIQKYLRDVAGFMAYIGEGNVITKDAVIRYKQNLAQSYAVASVNSILAAVNYFLRVIGCEDCTVKAIKVQRDAFRARERELSKEEYLRLLLAAKANGKQRLCLIMQTICATGIRISELQFITVSALYSRRAQVSLKGKIRTVILPAELCKGLADYVRENNIRSGSIFVTRNGKPVDRSNILRDMKSLCADAKVEPNKVYPHNLRHLFALTYYQAERDVCHLADLLGHSNINTTRIYTLTSGEEQEQRIDGLGLLL